MTWASIAASAWAPHVTTCRLGARDRDLSDSKAFSQRWNGGSVQDTMRPSMARSFATEVKSLRGRLQGDDGWRAVYGLRSVEEAWARHILGIGEKGDLATLVRRRVDRGVDATAASQAETHLARAEEWQWRIGSWATGAGEGLASMAEVYALKMARAWLNVALAKMKGQGGRRTRAALSLVAKVAGDPNGQGKPYARSITALQAILRRRSAERVSPAPPRDRCPATKRHGLAVRRGR
jgi:hypothetical protein